MKGSNPVVTLLGSNSGNNAGDAAILASVLDILTKQLDNPKFYVPTTNTKFVEESYGHQYNVEAVDVMPWTGSIRLAGIPTIQCLKKSDIALICDGIIFDVKLFNPAFNFLITLIFLVPFCKLFNTKLICYNTGIGPLDSFFGRLFARYVIDNCDLIMMREEDSRKLAKAVGVKRDVLLTGDAAFLNYVSDEKRASTIAASQKIDLDSPMFGVNVTSYVDRWLKSSEKVTDKDAYFETIAAAINDAKAACGFTPILFSTHPMDEEFAIRVAEKTEGKVISNTKYSSHDIMAMMKHCGVLMGMRFHSLILASAVETPIIGLVYAPKVRSFMHLLECQKYSLELAELSRESLKTAIVSAWNERETLHQKQKRVIDELKAGAQRAAELIKERYFSAEASTETLQAVG
ncbi:MAG: polysaccharide pyruvyl transferase family protein [Deltaproteobacteria bacterium]|nr:polysaccharide pyruvyl transferase family protein [Deltaproteobacteria bacterium]